MVTRAHCENGVGLHGWRGGVLGFLRKVNLSHYLICQPDSQFRIPVRLPVLQGTGESISADHTWVRSRIRDCDLTVYPTPYVQNGFVHFICHGSTQLCNYRQDFPPYNAIDIENKRRKIFPLIVTVTTMLIFIDSFPPSQESRHWLIFVGIRTIVAKFDVNDCIHLSIP